MTPVSAPADRRLRRASISPRRRSARRPWLRTAVAAVVVVLLVYGATAAVQFALRSDALTITRIAVSGHSRISAGEVRTRLADLIGTNLLRADLDAARRTLRSAPWVADAHLRRVFPNGVAVQVVEREAAAIGRVDGVLYVIDSNGEIVEEFGPNHADLDLPIVDGLVSIREGAPQVDQGRARLVGRLLRDLHSAPDLAHRLSQIDVRDAQDAVVVLKDDTVRVHTGREQFLERLQSYVELAPHLRERVRDLDYVDVRYGSHVYVRSHETDSSRNGRRGGRG